jgi:catechol 2,3-dioxygenase-like lactoylglutathione lyase family enzyme
MRIRLQSIRVDDQDKALAFYTDGLGFEKKHDIPLGGPSRWITVTSREGGANLDLVLEPDANPAGKAFQQAMFAPGIPIAAFESDDIEAEVARLKARKVAFTKDVFSAGPTKIAIFADTCGNLVQVCQPPQWCRGVRGRQPQNWSRNGPRKRRSADQSAMANTTPANAPSNGPDSWSWKLAAARRVSLPNAPQPHAPSTSTSKAYECATRSSRSMRCANN